MRNFNLLWFVVIGGVDVVVVVVIVTVVALTV